MLCYLVTTHRIASSDDVLNLIFIDESVTLPFLSIDHSDVHDEKIVLDILGCNCSVDSVMIDGSSLPLPENTAWTAKMVLRSYI